ncbi:MAG: gliding motility protein GldL [Bacteroidota bacterium]|uniref:Gliding motility-associated protein GldL n=2 Tax=Algoriphagus faecimaris TaxID=686796 RepID=A0A1G6R1X9_9BACT|nr:gliding motility protein GldL [Algoriphagus faecimaris]SDC98234.1 gliding motility-associated protein GldL [Algoriphagus faecimaris]
MASNSNFFYSSVMPKIYGIGAAVVILGAMFKILDWQGANWMIGIGLSTEAAIFFLSAFEPRANEVDWSKVYPELAEDGPAAPKRAPKATAAAGDQVSQKLDDMLAKAKVGPELIESLGKGMQNLATSAEKMGNLADAAVATNEYATNVKSAAKTLVDMNASYGKTAAALTEMSAASQDAKEYHTQVVTVTKNLSALNAVYEMELQDANSHVKTLNKFYSNMTAAMEGLSEAGKETQAFKTELSKLNQNVSSLNKIYGGMLSAMKG